MVTGCARKLRGVRRIMHFAKRESKVIFFFFLSSMIFSSKKKLFFRSNLSTTCSNFDRSENLYKRLIKMLFNLMLEKV